MRPPCLHQSEFALPPQITTDPTTALGSPPSIGTFFHMEVPKHYKIARGEAMECAGSLDILKLRGLIAPERYDHGLRLLESEVAMLTKMIGSSTG